MSRTPYLLAAILIAAAVLSTCAAVGAKEIDNRKPVRAGASAVDITPEKLPVIVSGGFLEGKAGKVRDRLFARC
ncbi:MAG: hypothetical protein QGG25_07745, partial [Phycisphaerae bacterium]|nr:hypothetical protein [Phycisphaerae bacterium]